MTLNYELISGLISESSRVFMMQLSLNGWIQELETKSSIHKLFRGNFIPIPCDLPEGKLGGQITGEVKAALWGDCFLFPEVIWRRNQGRRGGLLPGLCCVKNHRHKLLLPWTELLGFASIMPWWTGSGGVPLISLPFLKLLLSGVLDSVTEKQWIQKQGQREMPSVGFLYYSPPFCCFLSWCRRPFHLYK